MKTYTAIEFLTSIDANLTDSDNRRKFARRLLKKPIGETESFLSDVCEINGERVSHPKRNRAYKRWETVTQTFRNAASDLGAKFTVSMKQKQVDSCSLVYPQAAEKATVTAIDRKPQQTYQHVQSAPAIAPTQSGPEKREPAPQSPPLPDSMHDSAKLPDWSTKKAEELANILLAHGVGYAQLVQTALVLKSREQKMARIKVASAI